MIVTVASAGFLYVYLRRKCSPSAPYRLAPGSGVPSGLSAEEQSRRDVALSERSGGNVLGGGGGVAPTTRVPPVSRLVAAHMPSAAAAPAAAGPVSGSAVTTAGGYSSVPTVVADVV